MTARVFPVLAAVALACAAEPALAQEHVTAPAASAPLPRAPLSPYAGRVPTPGFRVSPYNYGAPFPPPQFYSELYTHVLTRQASFGHSKDVDQANQASVMIDRGDCAGAEAYLRGVGNAAMAARVPRTCDWKHRGLL